MAKKATSFVEEIEKQIEIAQQAVVKISDEPLKVVAFQVVLERLLATINLPIQSPEQKMDLSQKPQKESPKNSQKPKGIKGRVEALIEDGYFSKQHTIGEAKEELAAHGWHHRVEELSPTLIRLIQEKKLRRIKEPEKEGGKLTWRYSNW